jgi:hypothetical protein
MAEADFHHHRRWFSRHQFLVTAAVAAAGGSVIAIPPAAQAPEVAGTVPAQPTELNAWNWGLITAHRPEFTPAENRSRMAELRADIGDRFGLFQMLGRYVAKAGPEPIQVRAFLLQGKADDSGNLKGFLRKAGRKYDQAAVIWNGEDRDAVMFVLKEWPVLGLATDDKKNLGPFRRNQIAQYHALLARG